MANYIVSYEKKLYWQCRECEQQVRLNKCKANNNVCIQCQSQIRENADIYCCEKDECSLKNQPICETCYYVKFKKIQQREKLDMKTFDKLMPKKIREKYASDTHDEYVFICFFLCVFIIFFCVCLLFFGAFFGRIFLFCLSSLMTHTYVLT